MTINVLCVPRELQQRWLVLDRSRRVVDHGPDLRELCRRHSGRALTFYFANDAD